MPIDIVFQLIAVIFLVLANGFFVASEFALVGIRRSRVESLASQGHRGAHTVQAALKDLDRYIAGTQIGITIASIALGWIGEPALAHLIEPALETIIPSAALALSHVLAFAISFGIITFLHVVFGELVPKSLALQQTEPVVMTIAKPMTLIVALFRPLIWGLNGCGNLVLRLIGLEPAGEHHGVHSIEELQILLRQSQDAGMIDEADRNIAERALKLQNLTAIDVIIPRPDIEAIDVNESWDQILRSTSKTTHTRLPVYENQLDNVIGVLHLQDLFRLSQEPEHQIDIRQHIRQPMFVPETIRLSSLVNKFQEERTQIAFVVDEHGSIVGLATLEDVVEQIFGDLQDAQEDEELSWESLGDGRLRIRGDMRLRELNDLMSWDLRDSESHTIAGFIINQLGEPAQEGNRIEVEHGFIEVSKIDNLRIVELVISPKK